MLKTLHIIGSDELGGAERFFLRLVSALHEDGWETAVILRHGSALDAQLPAALTRFRLGMRTPLSRWRIQRIVRSWQPSIVQTYMGRATALTRLPENGSTVHLARLGGYYSLKRYRHAHGWIGNTHGLCDYLIEHGLPADRVFQIYNFIDMPAESAIAPAPPLLPALPENAKIMLAVGRLHPVKGLQFLLEAFARLPEHLDGQPVYLVIVGDGPLRQVLQNQAGTLGIAQRIHWAGWQNELLPYYRAADLVVFPSLKEETLGNVILESWAYGKPLLTSNSRGARELCAHLENAWCVPCQDTEALAAGMQHLLTQPELCGRIARAGQDKVRQQFNRHRILQQYQQLYQHLQGSDYPAASA
ncbi:MAG: glycosyltransferase [Gammaproteobacteria bacterium]